MEHTFSHFFHPIFLYLKTHPHAGELFTFLVAFLESLPLIGTVVPGTVTMTVVGILIGIGALPALLSLFIASGAAFCGDSIGFALGYHYNERLKTMWPFKRYPNWLIMGENFFRKHGGKSIILGRFIGPARSTVPMVAGLLRLTWLRFAVAAIPSAFMWAILYLTPGALLGAVSHDIPQAETTRFFLYGISIILAISLAFWLIQHFFVQLTRAINTGTDTLWNYLSRKNSGRFFIRFVTNQQDPTDHHQLTLLFTAILSGILFLILLINVRHHAEWIITINYSIFHFLQTIRTPLWNTIFSFITLMGMPKTIMGISILMTAGLLIKKQWRSATHFFLAFFLTGITVELFKKISHSQRPQGFEWIAPTSSFPSGHTTFSFVIFSFIAFLAAQIITKNYRWIGYTLSCIAIALVGFSRLYLGAHWVFDIVGSILLGLTVLLLCTISYRRMPKKTAALQLSRSSATAILLLGLFIPWTVFVPMQLTQTIHNTTPVWPKHVISIQAWWRNPLQYTPVYRNNRLGKPFQPFNVQWEGTTTDITKTLENQGWKLIVDENKMKLKTTLQRFASHEAEYHMPILPWLYRNKPPVLVFIKHIPLHKRIIELHLWESHIHFTSNDQPLLLGAIDIRIPPKELLSLKEHTTISLSGNAGLDQLYNDTAEYGRKVVHATAAQQVLIKGQSWNGQILLIRRR